MRPAGRAWPRQPRAAAQASRRLRPRTELRRGPAARAWPGAASARMGEPEDRGRASIPTKRGNTGLVTSRCGAPGDADASPGRMSTMLHLYDSKSARIQSLNPVTPARSASTCVATVQGSPTAGLRAAVSFDT